MNKNNRVIESFLGKELPLMYETADESAAMTETIVSLIALVGTLVLPVAINKFQSHRYNKESEKETIKSVHLYALDNLANNKDNIIVEKIREIDNKLYGMINTNPQYKVLSDERQKMFDQHMGILKEGDRLAFFSGSHIRMLNALIRRYYWFSNGAIKPSDHAAAIAEMETHLQKKKEFKYDKYEINFFEKMRGALKDPRSKGKFLIISD